MFRYVLLAAVITFAFTSCIERTAYYVSPFNANHNAYHTIPRQADSIHSAFYAGLAIYSGSANEEQTDHVFSVQANLSGAHNFNNFQAYYSGNVSLGNYKIAAIPTGSYTSTIRPAAINRSAGNNSFGGVGFDGGANYVLPFKDGEWRVIGAETSVQNEFGKYLQFRKQLPDSAATFLVKNSSFVTLGGYTELVGRIIGLTGGVKFAYGTVLTSDYKNLDVYDMDGHRLRYNYFNMVFHLSNKKVTGYITANIACKASGVFLGANYKFSK